MVSDIPSERLLRQKLWKNVLIFTGELKNKIDGLWDIFAAGGLVNPLEVIEQITYLMFIHDLDDAVFHDFPADRMYAVMQEWVFPFIKTLHADKNSAYSKYMDDAIFKLPTLLVLSKVVDPTSDEVICDPACGTSGFLVAAGEYLKEKRKEEIFCDRQKKDHYMNHMFHGYDMDRTMLRIGAMNMMTHGIENPFIEYRDSLSDQNADRKRTEQSFVASKQDIVENDYDLSINKYKEVEYTAVEYPPTSEIMADIRELEMEIGGGNG